MWLALLARHWRGVVVGLLVAALLVGLWAYGEKRYHEGENHGLATATEADAQQYKQAIQQRDSLLAQANSQLADAQRSAQQAAAVSAGLVSQLSAIKQQADSTRASVAAVPDTGLQTDIRQRIGQVPVSSVQPLTSGELRTIDDCIAEYPIVQQQVELLTDTVTSKNNEIVAVKQETDAVSKQRDAWISYSAVVEANYVRAYNAIPHKHRSVKCLWLWGCVDKKLSFPSPNDLHLQIPTPRGS